tara:strand:- start:10 stop:1086 length:1077 start_codon:yes stop_codon:yes gene_type:complete
MAYTTIDDPELFFQTVLFSGNAGTNAITLGGSQNMQPDWVWIKQRNGTTSNHLMDSVRGAGRYLYSNLTNAEGGDGFSDDGNDLLRSFDSNGFTLDAGADSNASGATGVGWCWKAGTSFSNDASATSVGTIDSTGSINTTSGFSIISYTGSSANSNVGTVAHGLGVAPKVLIIKDRDASDSDWIVFHSGIGNNKQLDLNNTGAEVTNTNTWNNTAPSSSVFTIGNNSYVNNNGNDYICYCIAPIKGYSAVGTYKGNGNADGAFVYTGFKPAWIMVKPIDATQNWQIHDLKRLGYNVKNYNLSSNSTASEAENDFMDIVSNGFKIRRDAVLNVNNEEYIYWAFAEAPFVNSSGVPNNAR